VVCTTSGEGGAYSFLDGFLRSLGHRIVGVLTTPGPRARRSDDYRSVVAAAAPGIDVVVSTHPRQWAAMLAPLRPDLIVSAAFPLRIPDEVIALPRLGAINGHDSLLPKYRGPNPQGWVPCWRDRRRVDGSGQRSEDRGLTVGLDPQKQGDDAP